MPQTLQSVLDNLGTPPPLVALDWARQILRLPAAEEQASVEVDDADDVEGGECAIDANSAFYWQLFQVADSGELALPVTLADAADSTSLNAFCLRHAKQLYQWGTVVYADLPVDPNYHDLAKAIDQAIDGRLMAERRDSVTEVSAAAVCSHVSPESSTGNRPALSSKRETNTVSKLNVSTPIKAATESGRTRIFLGTLCAIAGLGLFGWLGWSFLANTDSANQTIGSDPLSGFDTRTTGPLDTEQNPAESATTSSTTQLALSTSKLAANVLDDTEEVSPETDASAALSDFSNPSSGVLGSSNQRASENDPGVPLPQSEEPSQAVNPSTPTGQAQVPKKANGDAPSMDVDVMAELGTLEHELDGQQLVNSTTIEVTPSGSLKLPALSIVTFPAIQTVKVDLPREVRLRESQWELSLRFADGFNVTPSEPQTLTRARPLFWKVTSATDSAPSVTVNVAARLIVGRTPTVRWQIMASSVEAPGVALPLSTQYLSNAESLLANLRGRLEIGIASINQFYGQSPKEIRSNLTAQRKAAEDQLEICERLFRFAVDTRRITGLMDGQLEAHGRLCEVTRDGSTVVATFGEPVTDSLDE